MSGSSASPRISITPAGRWASAKSRCLLIENAIDTSQFARRTGRDEAKRRLGLDADVFMIGAVGRLSDEKGFDLLIRAVDRLLRDGHNLSLAIAGEGSERSKLEALTAELGQGSRIRLLGFHRDVTSPL